MKSRFFAISLFLVALTGASPAHADGFASRFQKSAPKLMPDLIFEDGAARQATLKDFKGHYVLLNLWATWCGPCVHEMASLNELQGKIQGLVIIALSEDEDGRSVAGAFYKRHNIDLPLYVDLSGEAPNTLRANGLPTTLLIDPNGMEIGRIEGDANWTDPDPISFLSGLMKPLPSTQPMRRDVTTPRI